MNPSLFADMKWRNIGPFRAGRTKAAAGHPEPAVHLLHRHGNGGVWKTTDAGRTWKPIFDDQPTGSIGWVSVAPSDPEHHLRRQRRGAAAARSCRPATASTSRPTRARPGRISACATRSRFPRSPSIRRTRIGSSSRRSAIRTARTRSAASSARPTAARRSSTCSSKTRTPAARTSTSIRPTPTSSTRRCGSSDRARGKTARGTARTAASSSPPTAATTWKQLTAGPARGPHRRGARHRAEQSAASLRHASKRAATRTGVYRSDDGGETWTRSTTDARPTSRVDRGPCRT